LDGADRAGLHHRKTGTIVNQTFSPISSHFQLSQLRRLRDASDKILNHNYRPVQKLNGRRVFFKSNLQSQPCAATKGLATIVWAAIALLLSFSLI
jgi:hypothetical protein